jgi:hypothetical protein
MAASFVHLRVFHRPSTPNFAIADKFFLPRRPISPPIILARCAACSRRPSAKSANPFCPLAIIHPCRSVSSVANLPTANTGRAIRYARRPPTARTSRLYQIRSTKTANQLHKSSQIQQIPPRYERSKPQTQKTRTRNASAVFSSRSSGESRQP